MERLQIELVSFIISYLDTKTCINLSKSSKRLNSIINGDARLWKNKSLTEYSVILHGNASSFMSKYIKLYSKLCVICYKRTSVIHKFKNIRICNNCQGGHPEYTLITKSSAKRELYLTESDFKGLKYFEKPNSWNRSRNIKVFLLSDIKKQIKCKFATEQDMIDYSECKRQEKFTRRIRYYTKFTILRSLLLVKFNIDIYLFVDFLNSYTLGMFRRYILNISSRQNNKLTITLMYKIVELSFLADIGYDLKGVNYTFFKLLLKDILLTTNVITTGNNPIIQAQINTIKIEENEAFQRKQEIIEYIEENLYSFSDYAIRKYIMDGTGE